MTEIDQTIERSALQCWHAPDIRDFLSSSPRFLCFERAARVLCLDRAIQSEMDQAFVVKGLRSSTLAFASLGCSCAFLSQHSSLFIMTCRTTLPYRVVVLFASPNPDMQFAERSCPSIQDVHHWPDNSPVCCTWAPEAMAGLLG